MSALFRYSADFFQTYPHAGEWLASLLLIPAVLLIRSILLRLHLRRHPNLEIDQKRRATVFARNVSLLAVLFGILAIWATQIQTFALSMVALAAATVLATKELIMCLSGSLLRTVTKQYSVGDYIEINHIRGRVIDINLFSTLVMQVGPNPLAGRMSGKTVAFPNSLLLNFPIHRDNVFHMFVIHTFDIPVPIHLDSDAIVPRLETILRQQCAPYETEIQTHLHRLQIQNLFVTPAAQPSINRMPFDDKVYNLVVRFAAPLRKRTEIQQAVLDEFIRIQFRLLNPNSTL